MALDAADRVRFTAKAESISMPCSTGSRNGVVLDGRRGVGERAWL
jgi:hypothetical protein